MIRTIYIGKVKTIYSKRLSRATITFETEQDYRRKEDYFFSLDGMAHATNGRGWYYCGQCLDSIREEIVDERVKPLLDELITIWNEYQLKYMKLVPNEVVEKVLKIFDDVEKIKNR